MKIDKAIFEEILYLFQERPHLRPMAMSFSISLTDQRIVRDSRQKKISRQPVGVYASWYRILPPFNLIH